MSARLIGLRRKLTRQRHDRDQTENQQNTATVDSCFELAGTRQHGVAQQKVEQPTRVEWSTKWIIKDLISQKYKDKFQLFRKME